MFSGQWSWDGQVVSVSVNSFRFYSSLKEELRTQTLIIEHRVTLLLNKQLKPNHPGSIS